jgi:hypothetical protein
VEQTPIQEYGFATVAAPDALTRFWKPMSFQELASGAPAYSFTAR